MGSPSRDKIPAAKEFPPEGVGTSVTGTGVETRVENSERDSPREDITVTGIDSSR